jgi:hypothetical protein
MTPLSMSNESSIPLAMSAESVTGPAGDASRLKDRPAGRRLEWVNLILVLAGGAVTWRWSDWALTWSFFAGGLLTVINLRLLRMIVHSLTRPQGVKKWKLVLQVALKYLGGLGALAAVMLLLHPRPVPFLLGLSTIVAAVLLEGVLGIFRNG